MPDVALALVDLESPLVVEAVRRACEDIGFLVITGHGVDRKLVAVVDSLSREFFDLPTEEKLGIETVSSSPTIRSTGRCGARASARPPALGGGRT